MHRFSALLGQIRQLLAILVIQPPDTETGGDQEGQEDRQPDPAHGTSEQVTQRPPFLAAMMLRVELLVDVLQTASRTRSGLGKSFLDPCFKLGELRQGHKRTTLVLFDPGLEIEQLAIDGLSNSRGRHLADHGAALGVGVLDEPRVIIGRGGPLCGGILGRIGGWQ